MSVEQITVGLVTHNSESDICPCLASLAVQHTTRPLRLICLDNASHDNTVELIERIAQTTVLIKNTENVGFALAHNQILRAAHLGERDAYLPLNVDVVLAADYIATLVDLLERTDAAYVSGKLLYPDGRIFSAGHALQWDGYAFNIGQGLEDDGRFDGIREVFGVPGTAPLISGQFIRAFAPHGHLYDSGMFLYYEDVDLDWRARCSGWRIFMTSDTVAWHRSSQAKEALRVEALSNRYRSVLRNAYSVDLYGNLMLIILHCCLRLLLTPRTGWTLTRQVIQKGSEALQLRSAAKVPRAAITRWFQDARQQLSGVPVTRWQRFRHFLRRSVSNGRDA